MVLKNKDAAKLMNENYLDWSRALSKKEPDEVCQRYLDQAAAACMCSEDPVETMKLHIASRDDLMAVRREERLANGEMHGFPLETKGEA